MPFEINSTFHKWLMAKTQLKIEDDTHQKTAFFKNKTPCKKILKGYLPWAK